MIVNHLDPKFRSVKPRSWVSIGDPVCRRDQVVTPSSRHKRPKLRRHLNGKSLQRRRTDGDVGLGYGHGVVGRVKDGKGVRTTPESDVVTDRSVEPE